MANLRFSCIKTPFSRASTAAHSSSLGIVRECFGETLALPKTMLLLITEDEQVFRKTTAAMAFSEASAIMRSSRALLCGWCFVRELPREHQVTLEKFSRPAI